MEIERTKNELKRLLENMECCGNCGGNNNDDCKYCDDSMSYNWCKEWYIDGLTQKERDINNEI